MPLTNADCKNAKPRPKPYKIFDGGGLFLNVTPSGGKHWKLKYRDVRSKEKKLAIGPYPIFSLADARLEREKAKRVIYEGGDPCLIKQEKKRQRLFDANNTFQAVSIKWQEHKSISWSLNHQKTVQRRLELDILPVIGNKPIAQLKAPDIILMLRKIEDRKAYEMARRALQYTRQIFDYAMELLITTLSLI